MKKTFITLFAVAGIVSAHAASLDLDSATLGYTDFSSGEIAYGLTDSTISTADGTITYTAPEGSTYGVKTGNYLDFTVTVVFDAEELNTLINNGTNGWAFRASNSGSYSWGFGIQDDGTSKAQWQNQYWSNAVASSNLLDNIAADGTITLTYSMSSVGTAVGINGAVDVAHTEMGGLKGNMAQYNTLYINETFSSAIEQIYTFSSWAQDDTDLNHLYTQTAAVTAANIPEPATASLSLLGLAALMKRRRRA